MMDKSVEVPRFLICEWGAEQTLRTLDAIRATVDGVTGVPNEWRLDPADQFYRLHLLERP